MAHLSIIIPVWNLWNMTEACLESIAHVCAQDNMQDSIEVIVVDNNSTDTTADALAPTLTRLFQQRGRMIRLESNMGFAKACNAGARAAKGQLLFFLNNDTVMTEGCIPPLLEALERNPKLGIVGPLLLYPGNKVQHAGICFSPTLELQHAHHLIPVSYVASLKQRFWQAITGAAMLMPAKIFHDCEGFCEEYVNGFEDLDLCCAVRLQGYSLNIAHKSIIYHHTSQTPGRFDNDKENAALLGKRRAGHFRPDMHKIALEAGLQPYLSPDLELYIGLTTAKEHALNQIFSENFDEERCKKRLETEPYWLGGYTILASYLEKQGRWQEALDLHLQAARLAPLKDNFANLGVCAANTGEHDILVNAKQCLQDTVNKTRDKDALWHKAQRLHDWATHNEDEELEQLFAQWLHTNA